MVEYEVTLGYRKEHLESTAIMLFLGRVSHFDNNFVLFDSILFIHIPNELYLHWLSADIRSVDLCGTL